MQAFKTFIVKEGAKVTSMDGERLTGGASVTVRLASVSKRDYLAAMDWISSNERSLEEVEVEAVKPVAQSYTTRDMSAAAPAPAPAPEPEPEPEVETEPED